jgi:Holliday junction resolvasome RuvABC endonuclease subunit
VKFLSIDQAATASGWSYWEDGKPIKWGVVYPSPKNAKDGTRLTSLRKQFTALIDEYSPEVVIIENPVGGQEDKAGPEQNWKTMQVLCQVQGILIQIIHEKNKEIDIVSPSSWQFTCGIHKRARQQRKDGAKDFVEKQYKLTDVPQDVCDSLCIGYHYIEINKKEISAF